MNIAIIIHFTAALLPAYKQHIFAENELKAILINLHFYSFYI